MTTRRDAIRGMALGAAGILIPARLLGDAPKSLLPVQGGAVHEIGGRIVMDGNHLSFTGCHFAQGVVLTNARYCTLRDITATAPPGEYAIAFVGAGMGADLPTQMVVFP